MLKFREITLEDRPWIQQALHVSDFMGCEYSFANNLAWRRAANSMISQYESFYLICAFETQDGAPHFFFPAGTGSYHAVFQEMAAYAAAVHQPLVIMGLTERTLPVLEQLFPGMFVLENDRDNADYLYKTAEMAAMAGKKYHKKRTQIRKFEALGGVYADMHSNDFDECIALAAHTYNAKEGYTDASSVVEQYAIHTFFQYFEKLGLVGGVLRVNGALAAFSVGEPICSNVFGVHLEKADLAYPGVFPAMAQQFAAHAASGYLYLNREEDLGVPGLRKSKLSYHPAILLEKWTATCTKPEKLLEMG